MKKKKLTKKEFSKLLKMDIEQLKAYILENDIMFSKHIPASDYQKYFDGIYENALREHAFSLRARTLKHYQS